MNFSITNKIYFNMYNINMKIKNKMLNEKNIIEQAEKNTKN